MKEKTFEELIREYPTTTLLSGRKVITDLASLYDIMHQVREATITEAVEFCVSQDWIKTIDNLKRLPTDRIYEFENPNR